MAVGYDFIMSGKCEDAIIGCANICFHPVLNLQFSRLGVLSSDGYCRPFDIAADGYSRSDTIAVAYLQKAKNAKRIYAICPYIKLNSDGYKKEGITYPSSLMQSTLLTEFYNECEIPISCLDYIEAHGTATKVGDLQEVKALHDVFCKNRKTSLMIGSVKSNLGHAEPASGFTQIVKALLAFETGFVPPNINYTSPRNDIDALINGTICVVKEPMPLKNGFIGINSFGFGGANAHMLLKWNSKQKINNRATNDDLPRLVILSGRTEESVKIFLNDVVSHSTDIEYIRLLHDIFTDVIDGHPWRGFIILNNMIQDNSIKEIPNCESIKRPVWFIFSALGTQWPGMGQDLLKFHVFANTIKKCDIVLKPYGINVTDILLETDGKVCENALYAFIGIVAVQIGLVDLLTSLGINPDYMISHSAGELGCAYADKCLTIEQTILSAYFIGLACVEGKVIRSSMALISFDYKSLENMCSTDIEIICRNSENSNIVCGHTESIKKFIKRLQLNNIHVKELYCDVPYHSSYLATVKTQLLLNLNNVIPQPKKRSSKWISSSIPRTEWFTSASNLSSADYHARSILNTVLFEQIMPLIPSNAVTIEIGPDCILQHILKESLHPKVTNIVLKQRTKQDIELFLQGIGKLYNCGLQPQVANLYPSVEFPVSRGTPMISPSIRWDHSKDWFITRYESYQYCKSRERHVEILLSDEGYDYMSGHIIDGKNLLPATGYLALVWETVGMIKKQIYTTIPIIFEDVNFIRATHLSSNEATKLTIAIQKDGKFEITEGNSIVVTGRINISNADQEITSTNILPENKEEEYMTARDIYKELKLRGYQYSGWFRGLHSASISGNKGHVVWKGNWVTFMDNMLQMHIIGYDTRNLYVPTSIRKLVIDPTLHANKLHYERNNVAVATQTNKHVLLPIHIYREIDTIISGGVEIQGLKATQISRRKLNQDAVIEQYRFIAHQDHVEIPLNEAIRISAQLALEDHQITKVKAIELVENADDVTLEFLSSSLLIQAFEDMPLIQTNITLLTSPNRFSSADLSQNILIADMNKPTVNDKVLIAAGFNLLSKQQTSLERLLSFLKEGGYLLTREKCDICDYSKYQQQYELNVILKKRTDKEIIVLLKKKVYVKNRIVVHINNNNFNWLNDLKPFVSGENKLEEDSRIIVVGEGDSECGLLGFVNCLRKEPGGERVRGVFIQDTEASKFSLQDPFYLEQLKKDMTVNVLRTNKIWGSYRHLRLPRREVEPVPTAHVSQTICGHLSTFCWTESDVSVRYRREDLVHVVYSSLNFKDVMLTTGKLINNMALSRGRLFECNPIGLEYVGFDATGQRVMGVNYTNCIANVVVKSKDLCWKVPDAWTFEEAATVPCVYSTVYLALYIYGKIRKGDKILIHSGTGGIGQAAIHVALKEGCEVFTTVGTSNKRNFIKKVFPTILDKHIGNSRDTSFEQMIMQQTNGRGVDIVLNSLAEEKLIASVRCLAQNGRFLEIGKFDLVSNNLLCTFDFQKGISFHGILFDNIVIDDHKYKSVLYKIINDDLKNGTIKPIQVKVFPKTDIEEAFRYMASGKHIGKIIINIRERNKPLDEPIIAYRRYYCLKNKSYIILGGLGGFGLELTDWLIFRGARNIVLVSRSGIKNGYQRMKIRLWESYGVNVLIIKNIDVADPEGCEYLLRTVESKAPVDAIFNLGVVLKDNVLKNQTAETFAESFQSKARATQNLDKLSRKFCPKLKHFVVFSSVSCGRGNAGQTNYGMANSVMERVCEKRAEEGLPGLAIQWGAVGDVGLVADMQEDDKEVIIGGTLQQKISYCLDELDKFLLQSHPVVSSMIVAEKKLGSIGHGSPTEAVAGILDIKDMKVVSQHTSLAELGMDSMMNVEVKQTLEREFDILLTSQEISNLTFAKLNNMSKIDVSDNNAQNKKDLDEESNVIKLLVGIVKDEDYISKICFELSTKKKNTTTEVFLVPGIDGCGTVFNHLTANIKFSATSLHYSINNIDATDVILETTNRLTNHILPKLKGGKDFVMVGYSFGSIIAIELTRKLEAMKFKGRLVLIDGTPAQMKMMYKNFTSNSNDTDLQFVILTNIMEIYSPGSSKKIVMELEKCNTWKERYDIFARSFLVMNTLLSPANLKTLCITVYKHSSAIRHYDPSTLPPIKSPIILLKPTQPLHISMADEDYGLHKVTQNMIQVHYVDGNHVTILRNEEVSAAINGEPPFII
ncbi:fatty acid synthase-like [Monomorium pharaonis]|uniref:fatty acid synthase-like n=1 Tax=Monomorium pharaonis TaxID=307658 RepID=UPI001747096D|nr:fatty acid synthase-like [Monomorium pharaonis]